MADEGRLLQEASGSKAKVFCVKFSSSLLSIFI